jgi:competence protein ComEC
LRSALMLSFVIAGNGLRRKTDIFNSLAGSAFILLCMNPLLIRDAGFQLSYIAVGGIVAVFPLLYKQKEERPWIWEQILSLLCVSLAAQLVTFPLSLYYFHQFPNYFLLANLFIVPLSSLVIYSGIGLLLFASIPLAGVGLGWCFRHLLRLLNQTVELTAHLPGSTLKNITLTITGTIFLYCAIIALLLAVYNPRSGNLKLFLTATIAFVTCLITGL